MLGQLGVAAGLAVGLPLAEPAGVVALAAEDDQPVHPRHPSTGEHGGTGPDEHPEVTEARKTWDPKSRWDLGGGGTAWDSIVYDPDTNIVYVGTGNGSPHPIWLRSPAGGDNLYLSSIVAIDADTGRKEEQAAMQPARARRRFHCD